MRATWLVAVVAGAALAVSRPARAQERCPVSPALVAPLGARAPSNDGATALALVDPQARLAYLRGVLRDDARKGRAWTAAWWTLGVAFVAGNATFAALTTNDEMRFDAIVETVKSLFIPAALAIQPMRAPRDSDTLESLATALTLPGPGAPRVVSCVPLLRAEELLVDTAEEEALATRWLAQTVVIGGNVVISAAMAFGLGHWSGAILGVVGGIGVGELQILTHPTGALDALEPYAHGKLGSVPGPLASVRVAPFAAPGLDVDGVRVVAAPAWGVAVGGEL